MALGIARLPELTPARGIGLVPQSPLERVTSVQGEVRRPVLREPGQHRQAAAPHQDGGDLLVEIAPGRDGRRCASPLHRAISAIAASVSAAECSSTGPATSGSGSHASPRRVRAGPCGSCASCVASSARRIALPRFRSFQSSRSRRRASGAPGRKKQPCQRHGPEGVIDLSRDPWHRRSPCSNTPKSPAAARFRRTIPGRSAARRRQRSRDRPAWRAGRGPKGKILRCRSAPASPEPLSIPAA